MAKDAVTGKEDPRIDKRRVTMMTVAPDPTWNPDEHDGVVKTLTQTVVDYVRPSELDAYVADARTRWQSVTVSDEPDAGPGGYDGQTHVPDTLAHPLAGQTFAATKPSKKASS